MIGWPPESQPRRHPSLGTLAAYAAGTLRAGFDIVAGAHVRSCAHCARQVAALQRAHGATLAGIQSVELEEDALARALARLDHDAPVRPPPAKSLEDLLASAQRQWVAPGVWVAKIDTPHAPDDRVYLLSAAPGVATARHGHSGLEFTQVLTGSLQDGEIMYRAGDFSECSEGDTHHPQARGDEPCVCLFATAGRLRPKGLLGQIAFALADV